jgi:hypothetical protein
MWKCYAGNLHRFCDYCLAHGCVFPPSSKEAISTITSFLEVVTWTSLHPQSTITSLSATISALYKAYNFHPT